MCNNSLVFFRCAFSLWVLLVKPCSNRLCGLVHHIDAENDYATPAMFLTNTGEPLTSG